MIINENNYADMAEQVILRLKDRAKNGNASRQFNNYENTNKQNNAYKGNSYRTGNVQGPTINLITTSQIRNLLAMSSEIYNEVILQQDDKLSDDVVGRIEYLRVRCAYEAGRDAKAVKPFIKESQLIQILKEINGSKKNFITFNRYLESLVAFHRFYDGKDN